MSRRLLTDDEQHLQLFDDGIAINKNLMKWKRVEDGLEKTEAPNNRNETYLNDNSPFIISNNEGYPTMNTNDVDSNISSATKWLPLYQTPEGLSFDEIASAGIKDLTRLIVEKKIKYVMAGYGSFGTTAYEREYSNNLYFESSSKPSKEPSKIKLLMVNLFKKKEKEPKYEFDALKFFSLVKATTKESAFTYKDRVSNYLKALHNSVDMGQTALQEELLKGLITNKYESLLFAEGFYYVIDEETIVNFIKKCEKGLSLDYIKNFTRPIPQSVVDKISKLNNLEIFDNYVVLHYDPEKKSYKETELERAKRKDPIIFGVIAGSKKLYYVTDWIDEYCDLTLEKFVDTLGITKGELSMDDTEKAEKKDVKQKKRKYYRRKNKKTN